ncbi:hypothetical protein SGCOL_011933 [Colletotrichum sp. CLE4]
MANPAQDFEVQIAVEEEVEDAKVGRVLDVGTGTGIWAVQFGDDHPEADILGIDLSATQPSRYA